MIDDPARSAGGALGEYAYREGGKERPVSEVFKDIVSNVQEMVRSEIRLAKVEFRQEASHTMSAAKLVGIGAGLALFAGAFVLTAIALLLSLVMPAWAATLLLGVVLGIAGYAMLSKGVSQMKMPTPQKTIENVKENVEWMKNQTRS